MTCLYQIQSGFSQLRILVEGIIRNPNILSLPVPFYINPFYKSPCCGSRSPNSPIKNDLDSGENEQGIPYLYTNYRTD